MKQAGVCPEKLLGKRVTHFVFGKGKVTRVQGDYIVAAFGGTERMFEFPAAFGEYLTVEDKRLQKYLPVCQKTAPEAVRRAPAKGKKAASFIKDEYDMSILADLVHCTL